MGRVCRNTRLRAIIPSVPFSTNLARVWRISGLARDQLINRVSFNKYISRDIVGTRHESGNRASPGILRILGRRPHARV